MSSSTVGVYIRDFGAVKKTGSLVSGLKSRGFALSF